MATKLTRESLIDDGASASFRAGLHGAGTASFIWVEAQPGEGPRLHQHPYPETFVILEGTAIFAVGDETLEATAGDIVIGPANVPHRFINPGPGVLRQIDIHPAEDFTTIWLED